MQKFLTLIVACSLLAACNLPLAQDQATASTRTEIPSPLIITEVPVYRDCYFNWATQALPALSIQIQDAMIATGLMGINATAEAYGENCYDSQTNEVLYFAPMETDFRVVVQVKSLSDRETLGRHLDTILTVLDGFPTETTPGPNPGYIGVTFQSGDQELRLWFTVTDGESARALNLHGAALLEKLLNK